jgi:hypothetical protein
LGAGQKLFVASYRPDGTYRFDVAAWRGDFSVGGLAVSRGNIYVSAGFQGYTEFGGTGLNSLPLATEPLEPSFDAIVLSYTADSGAFRWLRQIGTPNNEAAGLLRFRGNVPVVSVPLNHTITIDGHTVDPAIAYSAPYLFDIEE